MYSNDQSFFRMNLQPINPGSPATGQNQKPPLNLRLFWAVGIPLTLVIIVLPFLIGPIVRFLISIRIQNYPKVTLAIVLMAAGSVEAWLYYPSWQYINSFVICWIFFSFARNLPGRFFAQDYRAIFKEFFIATFFLVIFLAILFSIYWKYWNDWKHVNYWGLEDNWKGESYRKHHHYWGYVAPILDMLMLAVMLWYILVPISPVRWLLGIFKGKKD